MLSARPSPFPWRALAAIFALTALAYAPTLGGRFVLDDGVQIFRNPAVTDGASPGAYFLDRDTTSSRADYNTRIYRPLRNLAFRAIAQSAGVRPIAFKLANLVLYLLSLALVLRLALSLTRSSTAALWAGALWAWASCHVEAVVYCSALGDQLSLALELGALWTGLQAVCDDPAIARGRVRNRARLVPVSALLALGAMLAKEMAITEPVVLGALVWAAAPGLFALRRARILLVVHVFVAFAYLGLRTHVVGALGQEPVTLSTLQSGLRDAPWLLWHYVRLTVMPLGHSASYRVAPPTTLELVAALVGLALVAVLLVRLRARVLLLGAVWFSVSLAPVLHLVPLWADLADRFVLFPSVGLALGGAELLARLYRSERATSLRRLAPLVLGVLSLLYLGAIALEARAWRDDASLWRYAVDRQPRAPLALSNLSRVYLSEDRPEEALDLLLRLKAEGVSRLDVELRLGYLYERLGRLDESALAAARALTFPVSTTDPQGSPHALVGRLALAKGDLEGAARALLAARAAAPQHPSTALLGYLILSRRANGSADEDPRVSYLRAITAITFDDAPRAARYARACLRLDPARRQCTSVLGQALSQSPSREDRSEARVLLSEAIAALPDGPDRRRAREALFSLE